MPMELDKDFFKLHCEYAKNLGFSLSQAIRAVEQMNDGELNDGFHRQYGISFVRSEENINEANEALGHFNLLFNAIAAKHIGEAAEEQKN